VPIVLKSGSVDLLEPSGPVKACNGIALPSLYYDLNVTVRVVLVFQAGSPDLARKLPNGDAAVLQSPSLSVDKGTGTDSGGSTGRHGERGIFLS
jgi:hypothetical protein